MSAPEFDEGSEGEVPENHASGPASDARAAPRIDLPADVDAAFRAIVADWVAIGAPRWPDSPTADPRPTARDADVTPTPPAGDPPVPVTPAEPPAPRREPTTGPVAESGGGSGMGTGEPEPDEDEHYVPPEPPPLPRLGVRTVLGLLLVVGGVVLLAVPGLLGAASVGLGIVPGLLAMSAGLGWLVFGLRRPAERGDEPDEHGTV